MCRGVQLIPIPIQIQIRDVWNDNLEAEFTQIREIVDMYPYVAMDTNFLSLIRQPGGGSGKIASENDYEILKGNVDSLKLIQLGLTFFNEAGALPNCGTGHKHCIWQFNFPEFDVFEDASSPDSIEYLSQNGMDFEKNSRDRIDYSRFAELVMSSGMVLNDDMKWVAFHGGSGFGFLLKLLTGKSRLPDTKEDFLERIKIFFRNVYDVKHMMKYRKDLHGDLNEVAELLDRERVGVYRQAGSNSLLTYGIFIKLKESSFNGSTEKCAGVLFGLGSEVKMTKSAIRNVKGKEEGNI